MNKASLADEADALTKVTTDLIQLFTDDFVESTSRGCIVIYEESRHFAVTTRLERKKEAKHEKE